MSNPFDHLIPRPGAAPPRATGIAPPAPIAAAPTSHAFEHLVDPPKPDLSKPVMSVNPMPGTLVIDRDLGVFGPRAAPSPAAPASSSAPITRPPAGPSSFGQQQLATMDRIDRGEAVSEADDATGYQHMSPEQRASARAGFAPTQPASSPSVSDFLDPRQYAELIKGVVPGFVNAAGSAAQAPDVAIARAQHNSAAFGRRQLEIMDRIDRGETVREIDDALGYQHMSTEQRANARAGLARAQAAFAPTPVQDRSLYQAGEAVQQWGRGLLPPAPGYEEAFGRQVGEGLGSVAFMLPVSAMFGPWAGAGVGGAMGIGEATSRAVTFDRRERAAGRPGLTQDQITAAGLLGVGPGMTDALPVEVLIGRLPVRIPDAIRRPLAQGIARVGIQATIEGVQEGGQGFLQDLIAREMYDPSQVLGQNFRRDTEVGAAVGGITEVLRQLGSGMARSAAGRRGGAGATQAPPPDQGRMAIPADDAGQAAPAAPPGGPMQMARDWWRQWRGGQPAPQADAVSAPDVQLPPPADREPTTAPTHDAGAQPVTSGPPMTWHENVIATIRERRNARRDEWEAEQQLAAAASQPSIPVVPAPSSTTRRQRSNAPQMITTPDGTMEIEARPELVELDTLQYATGALQPRDRDRPEYVQAVRERATRLDPAQLQPSRVSDTGAPIVMPDGTILSGNGRVLSLAEAYGDPALDSRTRAYRRSLGAKAKGMRQPVLVMRAAGIDPSQAAAFADRSNRGRVAQMSASERAVRDARAVGPDVVDLYQGGAFTSPANAPFLRAFMGRAVTSGEMPSVSRNGEVTQEGVARMRAAVVAAAYGDMPVMPRILESTDAGGLRSIGNAMIDAAPAMARLRSAIAAGDVAPGMDPTPSLSAALATIADLRENRTPVQQWLAQTDAFGRDPAVEGWIRAMYADGSNRPRSQAHIGRVLAAYADEAVHHKANGLFADPTTPADVVAAAEMRAAEAAGDDRRMMAASLAARKSARESAVTLLRLGRPVIVGDNVIQTINAAVAPHLDNVPADVAVGALSRVDPVEGKRKRYRYTFTTPDGGVFHIEGDASLLAGSRALYDPGSLGGGTPAIGFVHVSVPVPDIIVGDLYHEVTHALRRQDRIGPDDWLRLVRHADDLMVLGMPVVAFKRAIGAAVAPDADPRVTIYQRYHTLYGDRESFRKDVAEEAAAHLVQLYHHGALSSVPPDVAAIMDGIVDGTMARDPARGRGDLAGVLANGRAAQPMFAAIVPFRPRKNRATGDATTRDHELPVMEALRDGADHKAVLKAAGPLLARLHDRYGFTVMRSGLPVDPAALGNALLTLSRGLREAEAGLDLAPPVRSWGIQFRPDGAIHRFDDGYGSETGVALPVTATSADLARFVREVGLLRTQPPKASRDAPQQSASPASPWQWPPLATAMARRMSRDGLAPHAIADAINARWADAGVTPDMVQAQISQRASGGAIHLPDFDPTIIDHALALVRRARAANIEG